MKIVQKIIIKNMNKLLLLLWILIIQKIYQIY